MWSHFCKKYKQGIVNADVSSYITKQSATAAMAYLSASRKKGGIKDLTEGNLPLVSNGDGPSFSSSSDAGLS